MVEMPMMSTQPGAEPTTLSDAAATADAPQGAFEEMLARRLGRQLMGRYAEGEHGAESDSQPYPWMPPSLRRTEVLAPGRPTPAPPPETTMHALGDADASIAQQPAVAGALPPQTPLTAAPGASVEPVVVKVPVNRPGFRVYLAEAGNIQPGPAGDVWTQPSGFADLHITRTVGPRGSAPPQPLAEPSSEQPGMVRPQAPRPAIPEPPVVHWSPAPARAALAASANRDLELEIVSQMASQKEAARATRPSLEVVAGEPGDNHAVPPLGADTALAADAPDGVTTMRPAMSPAQSSLIDRIMTAVEIQRHLPPPRAVSIEIPDMDGLRLLVTMRMDGTVHVASSAGTAQHADQVTPLLQAVTDALSERGFDMSADTGGRQDARPHGDDEAAPSRPRPSRFRRQARRVGLRI